MLDIFFVLNDEMHAIFFRAFVLDVNVNVMEFNLFWNHALVRRFLLNMFRRGGCSPLMQNELNNVLIKVLPFPRILSTLFFFFKN